MEIEIKGQKKQLKEMSYLDIVEIAELREKEGLRTATKKFLVFSGLTEEEAESLSVQDGIKIQKILNEVTQDFQVPTEKED